VQIYEKAVNILCLLRIMYVFKAIGYIIYRLNTVVVLFYMYIQVSPPNSSWSLAFFIYNELL